MDTRVIILCAGKAKRWSSPDNIPKQLALFNDEKLLHRTIRLLRSHNMANITVVAVNPELKMDQCEYFIPELNGWAAETLLSTQTLWAHRSIILLGDVFFSENTLKSIVFFDKTLGVFGRPNPNPYVRCPHGEIFALNFSDQHREEIAKACEKVVEFGKGGGKGNIWDLYDALMNQPFNSQVVDKINFQTINDYTDDIDSLAEYDRMRLFYLKNILNKNTLLNISMEIKVRLFFFYCFFARKYGKLHYKKIN